MSEQLMQSPHSAVRRAFRGKAKNIPVKDTFFLSYQEKWISDRAIMKLMEKSRRIGISYSTAYETVRTHALKSNTQDTWISSRDEPTARLFVNDCKLFTRPLKAAAQDMGERIIEKEAIYTLHFSNGTAINSVASNPDVFAGKGGHVKLDEFALRKDPRGVYSIASPSIDWGGTMGIISTHRGSANFFVELINEILHKGNPKRFSHHKVTLQDALDQGLLYKLQCKFRDGDPRLDMTEADYYTYQKSRAADEETFNQEYMCVPADDATTFLPYDLLATCELRHPDNMQESTEETIDHAGRKGLIRTLRLYDDSTLSTLPGDLFVGMDIGRKRDLSVIWIGMRMVGVFMPICIIELHKVEFSRQEDVLYAWMDNRRTRRCCIDATGLGMQLAENAQKRYGQYKAEAVTLTAQVKAALAPPVRVAFEDRSVRIPDDQHIIADLRKVKKETTASGNVRYAAENSDDGHADAFWALALAIEADRLRGAVGDMTVDTRVRQEAITEHRHYHSSMREYADCY